MCPVPVAQNVFHFKSILLKGYVVIYVSVASITFCWVCCVVDVIQLSSAVFVASRMKNQGLERQGDAALGYIIFGDSF
jgi:hypothetical protein